MKEAKKKTAKKKKDIFKKYNPKEDHQISQAVNFLRTFSLSKKFYSTKK